MKESKVMTENNVSDHQTMETEKVQRTIAARHTDTHRHSFCLGFPACLSHTRHDILNHHKVSRFGIFFLMGGRVEGKSVTKFPLILCLVSHSEEMNNKIVETKMTYTRVTQIQISIHAPTCVLSHPFIYSYVQLLGTSAHADCT